jgi:cytochrome P450
MANTKPDTSQDVGPGTGPNTGPDVGPSPFLLEIKTWALTHLNSVMALLRWVKPILVIKNFAVVTRFDDVQEVLARDDVFHVTYQAKMEKVTTGENFFLGMQNSPQYTRDVSLMRLAMRREDVPRIAAFVEQTAERLMAGIIAGAGNAASIQVDIVPMLTKPVPTMLVGEYFGTPAWNRVELAEAASAMFAYLFYPDDPENEKIALTGAAHTRAWLDQTIAGRRQSGVEIDDALGRCLKMQQTGMPGCDDVAIRNNFIGLLIGLIPTTSKCAVLCLDYLLSNPALLAAAQEAARANDDVLINQYVLESLRFNSFGPGLQRVCAKDYELAAGTWRATKIKAGTRVFVAMQSAMLDGRKLPAPGEFRLDRPAWSYMHYGYGLHTCFGQYINAVQIARIVKVVLKRKNLRRAAGPHGKMQIEGAFPAHMTVEFDPD